MTIQDSRNAVARGQWSVARPFPPLIHVLGNAVAGGRWSVASALLPMIQPSRNAVVGGQWSVARAFVQFGSKRTGHRPPATGHILRTGHRPPATGHLLATGHILAAILMMLGVTACRESVALPLLFPVPATTLTTDAGQPLNLDELRGNVVIYDFIFTNCAATCPVMAGSMRSLTREVDSSAVRFVSISVDPARDTVPVLSKYAAAVRNDDRWIFLTGERQQVLDLSVKNFKLAAGDNAPVPGAEALLHSQRFVVVDRQGMIRGYYDATSSEEMKRLKRDVRALLRA